ncbi:MAG: 50S ribosomal protein L11 methyltransferase [Alphaproteobacteria bacterium]|jgi:ribosomal protein L11 methyltransferase|nr:50S ribosomal protein L11 methyltransferase [Alphaproteobacteria bacterium]
MLPDDPNNLYTLRIVCSLADVEKAEALFEDRSLAISSYAPPPTDTAIVEILIEGKPEIEALRPRLPFALSIEAEPVGNLDWIKKVAADYPPFSVGRWQIFGGAYRDKITDFSLAIQVDSSAAFGTGEHPSTRGCLELLDDVLTRAGAAAKKWRVLDMGCGSGILSMACAKAAGCHVLGVDMEEPSVEVARENTQINDVNTLVRIEPSLGFANPVVGENGPYDLIMANIFADPLCAMAADFKKHLAPGGTIILCGMLNPQADTVIAAQTAQGLMLRTRKQIAEWSMLELTHALRAI